MTTTPPIRDSQIRMSKRSAPIAEAAVPSATNTRLKPRTNASPWLKVIQGFRPTSPEGETDRPLR